MSSSPQIFNKFDPLASPTLILKKNLGASSLNLSFHGGFERGRERKKGRRREEEEGGNENNVRALCPHLAGFNREERESVSLFNCVVQNDSW